MVCASPVKEAAKARVMKAIDFILSEVLVLGHYGVYCHSGAVGYVSGHGSIHAVFLSGEFACASVDEGSHYCADLRLVALGEKAEHYSCQHIA